MPRRRSWRGGLGFAEAAPRPGRRPPGGGGAEGAFVAGGFGLDAGRRRLGQPLLDRGEVGDDIVDLDQVVDLRPARGDDEAVDEGLVAVADGDGLLQLEADELLAGEVPLDLV